MEEENNRLKGAKREEMCDRSQEGASTTFGAERNLYCGKKLRVVFSLLRHFVSRQHFCKVTFLGFLKGGSVFDKNVGRRFPACDVGMYPHVLFKYC